LSKFLDRGAFLGAFRQLKPVLSLSKGIMAGAGPSRCRDERINDLKEPRQAEQSKSYFASL
jgi:hypothetical protein